MNDRQKLADAFSKALLGKVAWKPVAEVPSEGTVSLVTDEQRRVVGVFKAGEWKTEKGKALTFSPTYWMAFRHD